jgi:type IV secretory pathway protease TraF
MVACVSSHSAALARALGYLGPGPCAGGVQPVLKRVVAVVGDLVEGGPEAVTVNGLDNVNPGSSTAARTASGTSYRTWHGGGTLSESTSSGSPARVRAAGHPIPRADLHGADVAVARPLRTVD